MYNNGSTFTEIAHLLNAEKVPTKLRGKKLKKPNVDEYREVKSVWQPKTVRLILTNPVYIGTLVQGKTTTVSYKNHTMIKLPKEKWQIVSNAHDSIISLENWVKAQDRKQKNLKRQHA